MHTRAARHALSAAIGAIGGYTFHIGFCSALENGSYQCETDPDVLYPAITIGATTCFVLSGIANSFSPDRFQRVTKIYATFAKDYIAGGLMGIASYMMANVLTGSHPTDFLEQEVHLSGLIKVVPVIGVFNFLRNQNGLLWQMITPESLQSPEIPDEPLEPANSPITVIYESNVPQGTYPRLHRRLHLNSNIHADEKKESENNRFNH
jgi:hypothetical protein